MRQRAIQALIFGLVGGMLLQSIPGAIVCAIIGALLV